MGRRVGQARRLNRCPHIAQEMALLLATRGGNRQDPLDKSVAVGTVRHRATLCWWAHAWASASWAGASQVRLAGTQSALGGGPLGSPERRGRPESPGWRRDESRQASSAARPRRDSTHWLAEWSSLPEDLPLAITRFACPRLTWRRSGRPWANRNPSRWHMLRDPCRP
jgi:hypothetical protein